MLDWQVWHVNYKPLQSHAHCDLDWARDPKLDFPTSQETARGI